MHSSHQSKVKILSMLKGCNFAVHKMSVADLSMQILIETKMFDAAMSNTNKDEKTMPEPTMSDQRCSTQAMPGQQCLSIHTRKD